MLSSPSQVRPKWLLAFRAAAGAWALGCAALVGCHPTNVCGTSTEAVLVADGGGQPACTRGEDCPRDHDELVCESSLGTPSHDCVRCVSGLCERTVLEMCR